MPVDTNLSKKIDDMADEALKDDKPDSFARKPNFFINRVCSANFYCY
jgi:hypothetical protein